MIAGAYSSIFIASPLLAQMREADPDMVEHRERLSRRATRATEKNARKPKPVTVAVGGEAAAKTVDPGTLGLVSAKDLEAEARRQRARQTRSQRRK